MAWVGWSVVRREVWSAVDDATPEVGPRCSAPHPAAPGLFSRGSWPETARIADILRQETVGGVLLLVAAVVALVWANSPWSAAYEALRDTRRPGGAASGPDARASGPPTDCWRSSSSSPAWNSNGSSSPGTCATRAGRRADRRRGRRCHRPRRVYLAGQRRQPAAAPPGLGDPDRDRHRVRARGAGRDRPSPADGAAHVPAHPRRRG